MDVDSPSSSGSYVGSPRCPLCFERNSEEEKQTRIIHETASEREHTACTGCLKRLLKGGTHLECPFCREGVDIKHPVEELPIFVGEELELTINETTQLKQVVEAAMKVVCTSCEDVAVCCCIDCKVYLCEDCKRTHHKAKRTKMHVVQDLDKLSEEEKANFEEVVLCSDHSLAVDMYCPRCEIPCCLMCEEHLHHRYVKLKDVLEEKERKIKRDGTHALEKKDQMKKDVLKLRERKESVQKCKRTSIEQIRATVSIIIRNLKIQEERLLLEVSEGNDKQTAWFDEEIKTLENILGIMDTVEAYFGQKRTIGENKQLDLYKRIEVGLEKLHTVSSDLQPESENEGYYFQANSHNVSVFETMSIGRIYTDMYEDDRLSSRGTLGSGTDIRDVEIRVLAVGKKGSGRSRSLIALMTKEVYLSGDVLKGPGYGQWIKPFKGRTFLLSKTPGLDAASQRDLTMEKSDINRVTNPGPHVLLFVIKKTDDDVSTLDNYRKLFEDDLTRFLIIVFTGKKELEKRRGSFLSNVLARGGEIASLLTAVNGRHITVNTDDKDSLGAYRDNLFKQIRELAQRNNLEHLALK